MAKQYKTLQFEDTPQGRQNMVRDLETHASQGWELKSKEVSPQGWDPGKTCLLGCLFLPLALLGKKKSIITIILEKEALE